MREMSKWNSLSDVENGVIAMGVRVQERLLVAGPSHFGREISGDERVSGNPVHALPEHACTTVTNQQEVKGKFAITLRGECTFAQKARNLQEAGATLAIIIDNLPDSTSDNSAIFAMSGDGKDDIDIPAVFLFASEAALLKEALTAEPELLITVGDLLSLRRQYDNSCAEGQCDTSLQVPAQATNDKETFDHLKKVLSHIVTQFELTLSNDDTTTSTPKSCTDDVISEPYVSANVQSTLPKDPILQTKDSESNIDKKDIKDEEAIQNTSDDFWRILGNGLPSL